MFGKPKKFGLALGGGAARGFAHIGVLRAMEEAGLQPDYVAGTSVGSLIGALYCAGMGWQEIWKQAETLDWGDLVKVTMPTLGLVKADKLEALVEKLVEKRRIEDFAIPFSAVSVDLIGGTQVIFDRGPAGTAVRASCSIPGIFAPLEDAGRMLVDGGVMNNLPADVVKQMGANLVLAVDLFAAGLHQSKKPANLAEVMLRSTIIFMSNTSRAGTEAANAIVVPQLEEYDFHDMSNKQEMMEIGYEAARPHLRRFKKKLD